jgi:hypothetical protein
MIECVFKDKKLGKVIRKYLSALAEEGRFPTEAELTVTDDEAFLDEKSRRRVLFLTDRTEQGSFSPSLSLPCRREALAHAILRCLTS